MASGDIRFLTHNGNVCKILKVWNGGYYDLETINETEKGIIETYLSVHYTELIEEGNKL